MIHLSLNPDILFDLGQKKTHQFLVGFAAETNDVIAHGRNKVERKNLDMLIANDVAMPGAGFNVTTNIAAILYKDGTLQQYPKMAKEELGKIIIEKIAEKCNLLFNKRRHPVLELRKS
jgi:phosphopantothenoylcysteine decarboxylase/phosphopantothenate--cysteine ligase